MDRESYERVARLLERLADGEEVELDEFSHQGEVEATDADVDASTLRDLAAELRKR